MKKILRISLVSVLAVSPLMAMAAGERSNSLSKLEAPAELLTTTSSNLATVSYVGGAYKTTADKIDLLIDDTAAVNGAYVKAGKTVSANLDALDNQLESTTNMIMNPTTGLAKYVNDNYAAIEELNGEGPNSVSGKITAAIGQVNGASGDLDDLEVEADTLVGAINSVNSAVGTNTQNISTNTQNISTNAQNISTNTQNINTLGGKTISYVSSWSDPQVTTVSLSNLQ